MIGSLFHVFEDHLLQSGLPVISRRVINVPENSPAVTDLDINGHPEVVTWPNAVDRSLPATVMGRS